MGPRPFSRGYYLRCVQALDAIEELQWGHGLSAVDTHGVEVPAGGIIRLLQWGHGLSAVDTDR